MTEDMITQKAQQLIDGTAIISIIGRWALKNSPKEGRKCLERLSGGIGIAMPWLPLKDGQKEEYRSALRIIKEYERLKDERST
ncbi:hypothetical protein KAR91_16730 [Candidatus Pacearchaeota archaeon]|nr:hypothetical protein [Candidatus Pacearchaeota archaeon]